MAENIYEALFQLQGLLRGVKKDAANPHFKNRYATLEQVTDTIRPHFQELGLLWVQTPGDISSDGCLTLMTNITHVKSGTFIASNMEIPLAKRDPQGAGSAMTYAMRYSLMAMLGLPPTDDDAETAIDRDNKRPEPEKKHSFGETSEARKKDASKNEASRELYTFLQKDMRKIKDADQLRLWWSDNKKRRSNLPVSWQEALKKDCAEYGGILEAGEEDAVKVLVEKHGGKIVNDTFVDRFVNGEAFDEQSE